MVADCGATCAKYLLCLFNFVFFVVGSAVLCVGIWLAVDKKSFINLAKFSTLTEGVQQPKFLQELTEPTVIEQLAYILIAAGAFIFIISFLGYCGAIKESRVLLTAYGLFIIIIILLQVALIVVAAIYKAEAETHSKKFLQHTITEHYTHKSQRNAVTLLWDFAMSELHCCGVEGVSDFEVGKAQEFHKYAKVYADKNGVSKQAIPEACCKLKPRNQTSREQGLFIPVDEDCITVPTTYNSNMNKGCYDTIRQVITENLNMVIGIAAAVIGLQILFIIFAFCLCKAVGHDHDYRYKY
jgi:tetraspanin-18